MSIITNIQATDKVKDSRAVINANFTALNTDKVEALSDLGITVIASDINSVVTRDVELPSGMVSMTARASAPAGWLLCLGQAVSRTTYADLFAAISTIYGVGDGSTTFNVPNLQGRVPVGFDSSQTEFDTLGETGGAKTHTLTTAQMPSHTHTISNCGIPGASASGTGGNRLTDSGTATTNSTGSSEAHNNLQPYIALNYIIKT